MSTDDDAWVIVFLLPVDCNIISIISRIFFVIGGNSKNKHHLPIFECVVDCTFFGKRACVGILLVLPCCYGEDVVVGVVLFGGTIILFAWIFVGTWNFRSNSAYLDDVNYALIR